MTRLEKVKYLRMALRIQSFEVSDEVADRVIETYERIEVLAGDFSLKDAVNIDVMMDEKYKK